MKKKSIIIFLSCCSLLFANSSFSVYTFAKGESSSASEDSSVINITEDNLTPDICDGEDYSAKIQRIFYESGHYSIEIMIDNKSSNSIIFNLNNSDVDGFQISMGTSCNTIDPGKKGVVKFGFQEQEFTDYGIEDFDCLNTVFSVFASENAPTYPLCIKKEVFMKDSSGNTITTSSSSQLQQRVDELTEKVQELESENQKLKNELSEYKNAASNSSSSTKNKSTVSITNFVSSVPNDVTGKWRLATVSTAYPISSYALNYYKKYFKSNDEIHGIINKDLGQTYSLSIVGGQLYVATHQYIDGEENDASLLFGGDVISQIYIDLNTGTITIA